jgi:hypothetical protein
MQIIAIGGTAIAFIIYTLIWMEIGKDIGTKKMRIEAVKKGLARWVPMADGSVSFEWLELGR